MKLDNITRLVQVLRSHYNKLGCQISQETYGITSACLWVLTEGAFQKLSSGFAMWGEGRSKLSKLELRRKGCSAYPKGSLYLQLRLRLSNESETSQAVICFSFFFNRSLLCSWHISIHFCLWTYIFGHFSIHWMLEHQSNLFPCHVAVVQNNFKWKNRPGKWFM